MNEDQKDSKTDEADNSEEEHQMRVPPNLSVAVPVEMQEWLKENTQVNRSKVFQDAVNAIRYPQVKKVSSQIVLMMFMNFVISMAIIFTALLMPGNVVSANLRYILIFLACILTVVSLMTYRFEKTKIRQKP